MTQFQITREDGRSNAQVVIDLVKSGTPGQMYSYDELSAALSEGTDREYESDAVRSIVMNALPRLLREHQRALHNVRGEGYRLAFAGQHRDLAIIRKRRADTQLRRGLLTLQHVKWDEMSEQQRAAHEGTLMIMGALWQAQTDLERRQSRVEDAIRRLRDNNQDDSK